jgi:hypothetical protein
MSTFSFFTNGVLNAIPGQPLESDHQDITYLNPLGSPLYSTTNIGLGAFPLNITSSITYTNILTGQTASGNVTVGAVSDPNAILAALYAIIPRSVSVTYNATTTVLTFTSTIAGTDGNFLININGSVFGNSSVAGAGTILKVGRFLVPVTNNGDLSVPANDSTRRFRYPVLGDNLQILSQGVFSILSMATNIIRYGGRDTQGTIQPGSTAPGLLHGLICVYPITPLNGSSTLFVETNPVNDNVGRLTATPTATTLALPTNKLFVESGVNAGNLPAAIRL